MSANQLTVNGGLVSANNPFPVIIKSSSSSGIGTAVTFISTATTNVTLIKSSSCNLYRIHLVNNSAVWAYLKIFNKATAPVLGTDTPLDVHGIPPGGFLYLSEVPIGDQFNLGVYIAVTLNPALLDATALAAANTIVGTFRYT